MPETSRHLEEIFPRCRRLLGSRHWQVLSEQPEAATPELFPEALSQLVNEPNLPPWLAELARIELAIQAAESFPGALTASTTIRANPTLSLLETAWRWQPDYFSPDNNSAPAPEEGEDYLLVWRRPDASLPTVRSASREELLALKLVVEGLDRWAITRSGQVTMAALEQSIARAVGQGLLIAPPSAIRRDPAVFSASGEIPAEFLVAETFTLQWHLTQTCDLHCRHCYDRSPRPDPTLPWALTVLDQLYDFCQARHVAGQVTFTGGNPLLHPNFLEIYRAAAERGFLTAILGNPTSPANLARINAIQRPEFFQVSLEGLPPHNDYIRGAGHFQRVLGFLEALREAGIFSMVMLTMTRDNQGQVLELAELLRERADLFTFNRLAAVGEGAKLTTPDREGYAAFLSDYLAAARHNPMMGLKDSLINIIKEGRGEQLFGGCAGFGCGAAFNFVALLPEGEIHACRKFPSPIGDLNRQGLGEIYDSAAAASYRRGPAACQDCRIRQVCGGCQAVIAGQGLRPELDCDPCCFIT